MSINSQKLTNLLLHLLDGRPRMPYPRGMMLNVDDFDDQLRERARKGKRRCEPCNLNFRTTREFHDHNVFTHY